MRAAVPRGLASCDPYITSCSPYKLRPLFIHGLVSIRLVIMQGRFLPRYSDAPNSPSKFLLQFCVNVARGKAQDQAVKGMVRHHGITSPSRAQPFIAWFILPLFAND